MGFSKKNKMIKVGAVSPRIRLCDVAYNTEVCIREAKRAAELGVRVLVFPELTLTGATCGDLFCQSPLAKRAEQGLAEFIEATKDLDMMSLIGLPAETSYGFYSCTAVVYRGELLGLSALHGDEKYFDMPADKLTKIDFAGQETKLYAYGVFTAPFDKDIDVAVGTIFGLKKSPSIFAAPASRMAVIEKTRFDRAASAVIRSEEHTSELQSQL